MSQMYEMTVVATGEVRDAEGNLISTEPIESKITVTEAKALAIIAATSAQAEETE